MPKNTGEYWIMRAIEGGYERLDVGAFGTQKGALDYIKNSASDLNGELLLMNYKRKFVVQTETRARIKEV